MNDGMAWNSEGDPIVVFEFARQGSVWVLRRCPNCGRFIKVGYLQINGLDEVRGKGWLCGKCGEVQPVLGWI